MRHVSSWARRAAELHREFAAIAEVDPRWWLLAGGAALAEQRVTVDTYLACAAEPDADTLMGYRAPVPRDPVRDAIVRAHAARTAIRELDGTLPDQPLAVTVTRAHGAATPASALDSAGFAVGRTCLIARLDDPTLPAQLTAVVAGAVPKPWHGPSPFVCVSIGDEPLATARHGHRRAWNPGGGPWLGLGRADDLAIVSTCHLVVDGYGHARIAARIAELVIDHESPGQPRLPTLAPIVGAVPLTITWREMPSPMPRVIPMAYALGCILHGHAGHPRARFSPTMQIPIARGAKDDPQRVRRRVVAATTSVRFSDGRPEPFTTFEARVRTVIAREANGRGLVSRLLAAARAMPIPLAWKRQSISAKRPPWLERFAEVIGGRALVSRMAIDTPIPAMCAVSSPSRMATVADPIGGCVITVFDDGIHGAISICGSGFAGTQARADAVLDQLLAKL
jgi:hypothetical protein